MDTLTAIGVNRDGVGSTTLAGAMDPFGAMTEPVQRIIEAKVVKDRDTGRSRGFGFVEMDDEGATAAMAALDGLDA